MKTENETESTGELQVVQTSQAMADRNPYERMLETIVNRGGDMEALGKMMDLKERWDASEARKAFNVAFAEFKAEAITVIKGTKVTAGPLSGTKYANLFDITIATAGPLAKHGLTTAWKVTKDEPALMEVTCVLKHSAGHFETVSMSGAPDTGPGRNAIQARGSIKTYLEKYTLTAILGIASTDQDDDGAGANKSKDTKVGDWIAKAEALNDAEEYGPLKLKLMADYGDNPAKIPKAVRTAFNEAMARVMSKDEA